MRVSNMKEKAFVKNGDSPPKILIPIERIEGSILLIRGQKVILDRDLAILYQVSTANLNKAVSRNLDRFPEDFMLQLTEEEFTNLIFHFGTSSWGAPESCLGRSPSREWQCFRVSCGPNALFW